MHNKRLSCFALMCLCALLTATLVRIFRIQTAYSSDLNHRLNGPLSAKDPTMLALLRDIYILPPDLRPYNYNINSNNWHGWLYNQNNKAYGTEIAVKIQEMFSNIHGGFFIEAGALDGVYLSNTLWLEQERGWTGLLVEPNIFSYRELLSKHRKAWVSNTCLSNTPYPRQTVLVTLRPKSWVEMKMNVKGSSHQYDINQPEKELSTIFNAATRHLTTVQCFPLISYLLALNVSTVDFLSLDLQGAEIAVLDTLPWESVNIRTVAVEMVMNSELTNHELIDEMHKRGYIQVNFTQTDYLFIKKGDPLLDK